MADITIDAGAHGSLDERAHRGGIFWVTPTTGYAIYIAADNDLVYNKTANGGATWGGPQHIKQGTCLTYDAWADWQTAGDAGTKIHVAYMDTDTDDVRYIYLDTNGDSVGGDDQIEACQGTGSLTGTDGFNKNIISIAKTRGGNLVVAFRYQDSNNVPFYSFYTSPDAAAWTSETAPWEATNDQIKIFPGNEADNQDVWAIFQDASADEISLKTYDDSGNSWSEQLISGSMIESPAYLNFDGQVRLSDGHLLLAAWNEYDSATADLETWDINGAGSITAKTDIVTDTSEAVLVSVFINQVNDDWYVTYAKGGTWLATVQIYYQKSADGGANWDGETAMQVDAAANERWVSAGCMKAAWGGKFQPVWFNDTLNDVFTSADNGVSIAAAAGEQELTAAVVAVTSSVQTSTISGSGNAPLTAAVVAVTSSVANASISGSGSAPLTGTVVSVTSSVVVSAIAGTGTAPLTAAAISVTSSVQAATIRTSVTILTAAAVSVTSSIQTATIRTSVSILTAASVSVTSSVQNASVAGSGAAPLTGTVVSVTTSVQQAKVFTTQILTAGIVSVTSSVQNATIAGSGTAPLTAAVVGVTSSVQGSVISGSGNAPLTGAVVSVTSSVVNASISGSGSAPLTGAVVSVTSSVVNASLAGSGNAPLTAAVVSVLASVVASSIAGSGSAPLTGAIVAVTSSVYRAVIAGTGTANLTANYLSVVSSVASGQVTTLWLALFASPLAVVTSVVGSNVTLSWILVCEDLGIDPSSIEASRVPISRLETTRLTSSRQPLCRPERRYT